MHIENDLVEFGTTDDLEYEEEIFMLEEFQEPSVTDTTDLAPAQGKPQCTNRILITFPPVRLSLSARLISRGTVFFSHSKSATAGL
jgi:hypothetical protein